MNQLAEKEERHKKVHTISRTICGPQKKGAQKEWIIFFALSVCVCSRSRG